MLGSFMPYAMLLLLALAACSPQPERATTSAPPGDPSSSPPAVTDTATADTATAADAPEYEHGPAAPHSSVPTLTTFRTSDGALANLTFRTAGGTTISDSEPLILVVEGKEIVAPLVSGPARSSDPDGTVVDQAGYHLSDEVYRALSGARTDAVTVRVADATVYHDYPYLSGDTVE